MIYWIVVLGGGAVAASGYLLMFPFYLTDITGMQVVQMIHGVIAVLFVAVMLAHIYIGTIGMEGAFEGMWDGTVDLNWAKEHHSLWLNEEMSGRRRRCSRCHGFTTELAERKQTWHALGAVFLVQHKRYAHAALAGRGASRMQVRLFADGHPAAGSRWT
jgi:hypothetical protein